MTPEDAKMLGELEVKRLSSGYLYISGRGPCNWAQGPTFATLGPFVEAGINFLHALAALARKGAEK